MAGQMELNPAHLYISWLSDQSARVLVLTMRLQIGTVALWQPCEKWLQIRIRTTESGAICLSEAARL